MRRQMGAARFKVYDAGYAAAVADLRDALGDDDFEAAWAEGAALSIDEAVAYAAARSRRTQAPVERLGIAHPNRA